MKLILFSGCLLAMLLSTVSAGEADVLAVEIIHRGGDRYLINTTVQHADTGWDHYANAWEVLDENGNSLGKRVLLHPHVDEQPFTRSHTLSIPVNVEQVTVRAVDSVHGTGGKTVTVAVPR